MTKPILNGSSALPSQQQQSSSSGRRWTTLLIPLVLFVCLNVQTTKNTLPATSSVTSSVTSGSTAPRRISIVDEMKSNDERFHHPGFQPPPTWEAPVPLDPSVHDFSHGFVHVVKSRFMQNQPDLKDLGVARLRLFETFCLSTLAQQTNQKFLWIIRTDPDLHSAIKIPLLELLHKHPNIILLPDNGNGGFFRTDPFFQKKQKTIDSDADAHENSIWSGSPHLLRRYFEAAQNLPVVETRIDADDGLPLSFVADTHARVQQELHKGLAPGNFKIWCVLQHTEWHVLRPIRDVVSTQRKINRNNSTATPDELIPERPFGYLKYRPTGDNICPTPGMTSLFAMLTGHDDVPSYHHRIEEDGKKCKDDTGDRVDSIDCWEHVYTGTNVVGENGFHNQLGAIRARTPTSAGMSGVGMDQEMAGKNIEKDRKTYLNQSVEDRKQWKEVLQAFDITWRQTRDVRTHFLNNLGKIAADNLKGQCTTGHSCKDSAKERLQSLTTGNANGRKAVRRRTKEDVMDEKKNKKEVTTDN